MSARRNLTRARQAIRLAYDCKEIGLPHLSRHLLAVAKASMIRSRAERRRPQAQS